MENASKAVLIAGVVLLVLSVTTIIVCLFNVFKNTNIDLTKKIDTSKIQYHNSQFVIYGKDKVAYSEVEKIIRIVENSNKAKTGFNVIVNIKEGRKDSVIINNWDDFNNLKIDQTTIFKVVTDIDESGAINRINVIYN